MNNSIAPGTKVRFKIPGKRKHADGVVDKRKPTHCTHHTKVPVKGEYGDEFWCLLKDVEVISEKPNALKSPSEPPPESLSLPPQQLPEQPDNFDKALYKPVTSMKECAVLGTPSEEEIEFVEAARAEYLKRSSEIELTPLDLPDLQPHPRPLEVDAEFKSLIPPLSQQERSQLENNIQTHGCIDAIQVWKGHDIIIDGHNRHEICTAHDIPYQVKELEFLDREAVIDYMISLQLGRRNLLPDWISYLRGKRYNAEKRLQGGTGANQYSQRGQNVTKLDDGSTFGQNVPFANRFVDGEQRGHFVPSAKTSSRLANEYKVSDRTIKRDAQFSKSVDTLVEIGVPKSDLLGRDSLIAKADILKLAKTASESPDVALSELEQIKTTPRTRKPKTQSTQPEQTTPANFPSERTRVIVTNPNSPFLNQRGTVTGRPNRQIAVVALDQTEERTLQLNVRPRETFLVSELSLIPQSEISLLEIEDLPPTLEECQTAQEVYSFILYFPNPAKEAFLKMEWSSRNDLRELTHNTVDSILIGKLKEMGLDFSMVLGLLEADRMAQIEYLQRELNTLKALETERSRSLTQLKMTSIKPEELEVENQSDEWLEETVRQCQQELNRRRSDSSRHLRLFQGKLSL